MQPAHKKTLRLSLSGVERSDHKMQNVGNPVFLVV